MTKVSLKPASGVPIFVPFFLIQQVYPNCNSLLLKTIAMNFSMASVEKSIGSSLLLDFKKHGRWQVPHRC